MSLTSSWGRKHRLNCTSPVWNGVPGLLPADDLNGWVILYKSLNMVYKKGSFGISFFGSSVYNCGGCWTGLYRVEHWAVIVTRDAKDTSHSRVRNVFAL
jgi:hypothetical protein